MKLDDLARLRLRNQHLTGSRLQSPLDVVRWNLAVQSQDYPGAKWGIGQRAAGVRDTDLDTLFDEGAILRTHVMRPTWHFVLPEDIRWLLALTAPRVQASNAGRYRQLGLDTDTLVRSSDLIARELAGGTYRTRAELGAMLEAHGIDTAGQRLAHTLMYAELEAIVCSGPRRGKQFTYALLDERAAPARELDRDEAVALITRRYLESHGPATPHDLAWWSGLTVGDARRGIEMHKGDLESVTIDGTTWWHVPSDAPVDTRTPVVHLLPNFDEYFVGFRNNEVAWDPAIRARYDTGREFWLNHYVVLDGRIVGAWTRKLSAREVRISLNIPAGLDDVAEHALAEAAAAYGEFLGLTAVLESD